MDKNKINWEPLVSGGVDICTRNAKVEGHKLTFIPNTAYLLITSLAAIVGILIAVFLLPDQGLGFVSFMLLLFCMALIFGGINTTIKTARPMIFDKELGYFINSYNKSNTQNGLKLEKIMGIQIITEKITRKDDRGRKRVSHSHEVNLLMNDYSRVNIVDHSKKDIIIKDAKLLAEFLEKPILTKN